jgi:methylenetetrahydrofolate dehydrogenase (NADP+) / methenyltetrahydrofolate cyclohydrolase
MVINRGETVTALRLDGKLAAQRVRAETAARVNEFRTKTGIVPKLAAILVGDNPASEVYVRNKQRACEEIGIASDLRRLSADDGEGALLEWVLQLNQDREVHGILVQLPLPKGFSTERILDAVHPLKDVDAFHAENVGLMTQGRPRYLPCTAAGVVRLLFHYNIPTSGKHVVIVGRSDIVGKPLGIMLVQRESLWGSEFANATVTIAHSRTPNLSKITRDADILVAAVGVPNLITAAHVRAEATVVDVGINRVDAGLVGDVDFRQVEPIVAAISPVPGGVGPMTIAMLLQNTLRAAEILA